MQCLLSKHYSHCHTCQWLKQINDMRTATIIVALCCLGCSASFAQSTDNDFKKKYEEFRNSAKQEYEDFRQKANKDYENWLRQAWESYKTLPEVKPPKEDPPKPVKYDDVKPQDDKPKDEPKPYDVVVITIPTTPQPMPVAPIRETPPVPDNPFVEHTVTIYGTPFTIRVPKNQVKLSKQDISNNNKIADAWAAFACGEYDNTVRDCLLARTESNLSDWAYLRLVSALADDVYGLNPAAAVMKVFILSQSGYCVRLAKTSDRMIMLFGTKHIIYQRPYLTIDGLNYFSPDDIEGSFNLCNAPYSGEKPFSLYVKRQPILERNMTAPRVICDNTVSVELQGANQNIIDFMADHPNSQYGSDPLSRWFIYANTPIYDLTKEQLYQQLKSAIKNDTPYAAVNKLCQWIQRGFVYEYDDKVWGGDRAFFPDETLYYPYCDCEDRSILLTRIVTDLLGLKCLLVYYPGHLATAIALGEDARGEHIRYNGEKYIVCDPTFIGAPIGHTMPGMDNLTAKVILVK